MPKPLSDLERRVLDYLVEYLRENTYQPSIREIGRRFGIKSTKTVSELLQSLAAKGWIERDPSRSRGVRLLGHAHQADTVSVPWYGIASRARSAQTSDAVVEKFELDRKLVGAAGTFIVTMAGDSMGEEGIRDGDLLLVEPVMSDVIESGDLVLALADGAQCVRRLDRDGVGHVLWRGTGQDAAVTVAENVEIVGRVVSIVRRLRVPATGTRTEP